MNIASSPPPSPVPISAVIILTGLSGAGKSTAMRFLEDLGYYCIDNLPPALAPTFLTLFERSGVSGPGVVIASDVRSGALLADLVGTVKILNEQGIDLEIIYLDCDTETLISRFKEVRRSHPLQAMARSMEKAIEEERRRLTPIREIATRTIDTSELSAAKLREVLLSDLQRHKADAVSLEFVSFGFKHGLPRDVDFVLDLRFLPNPFYIPELRAKTGLDPLVSEYVMGQEQAEPFFQQACSLVRMTLPGFFEVGKTGVTVGVGCTGGKHRSVAFAERMTHWFLRQGHPARSVHRDIERP
jgi:UPF0042 nucleotide-binding protein